MNRNDTHSLAHVRLLLGPFYKQRQSLLKMIPRLNVLNYVCSYSALFGPNTPRTVYECRCQPSPSHENQSCAVEIKASSFVFSLYYSWKQKVYHIPTVFCVCLVFHLWEHFFSPPIKHDVKSCISSKHWHFYPGHSFCDHLHTLFWHFHPICFSGHHQSKLSHRVTCTCQSCIARIQHILSPLQTWFTWSRCSLTADVRGSNNCPFRVYRPVQSPKA